MGGRPRLPLTGFERTGLVEHQSLAGDHLAYCGLVTDRQQRANDIVRKHHALTVSRVNRRTSTLADSLRPTPKLAVGGWSWVYSSASTIRQGVKANTDAKVPKAKIALNWTGPYKVPAVGPCSSTETPDGPPLGDNLIYVDLPSDLPGSDDRRRVGIERCKPYANSHGSSDMPKYIPAGLTQYVLINFHEVPSVTCYSRRRFGSPPTTRGGEYHRPPVGPGTRWRHRGVIHDAFGGTLRTILGAGNGPLPLSLPHFALLGRHSGPASPNQPPLPPDADWCGTS